jgi:hypothetical protein
MGRISPCFDVLPGTTLSWNSQPPSQEWVVIIEPSAEAFLVTSTEVQLSNSSQESSSCSIVLFFPEWTSTKREQKDRIRITGNIPLCFTFYLLFIFYFISLLSMMKASTANKNGAWPHFLADIIHSKFSLGRPWPD